MPVARSWVGADHAEYVYVQSDLGNFAVRRIMIRDIIAETMLPRIPAGLNDGQVEALFV
jgi:hypothetical protein